MIIDVQNVTKVYKSKGLSTITALDNVSYSINKGDAVGLIGMNGAGKSTTIKLITGILRPTSGNIRVMGMSPFKNRKTLCYKYGVMFGQRSQLWWDLPARDSFFVNGSIYGLNKKQIIKKLDFYNELIDIPYIDTPVRELSLGQKMVCEILLSMLHDPEILFLDEATIALDIYNRKKILNMISVINKDLGITLLITSHLLGDIENICDKVILLNKGSLFYDGKIKNFLNNNEMCKMITAEYNSIDVLQQEMHFIKEICQGEISLTGNIMTVYCKDDPGIINKILYMISSNQNIEEFSIRNVTLEEKLLAMEGKKSD